MGHAVFFNNCDMKAPPEDAHGSLQDFSSLWSDANQRRYNLVTVQGYLNGYIISVEIIP